VQLVILLFSETVEFFDNTLCSQIPWPLVLEEMTFKVNDIINKYLLICL
jgi:hypothetical protein